MIAILSSLFLNTSKKASGHGLLYEYKEHTYCDADWVGSPAGNCVFIGGETISLRKVRNKMLLHNQLMKLSIGQ